MLFPEAPRQPQLRTDGRSCTRPPVHTSTPPPPQSYIPQHSSQVPLAPYLPSPNPHHPCPPPPPPLPPLSPSPSTPQANILSLRNQLPPLPAASNPSISEKRLIALVGERLLDANLSSAAAASNAGCTDLQQNLSDSLDSLHKLCVGMDVNVRFNSVFG